MIERTQAAVGEEAQRLFRFVLIGGVTVGIYLALYAIFSRLVWPQGNRTLEQFVANVIAATFNFFAHRSYTFRSTASHRQSIPRYLIVLVTAMALQALLFWIGHEVLKWYDLVVAVAVAALIPLYTYLMHRLYTFREGRIPPASDILSA